MRDPGRIPVFCSRLAQAWAMVPDWRFGQLMVNALGEMKKDPFFPEDEEMIQYLEIYTRENSPYYTPPREAVLHEDEEKR